jgi:nuclear transport factor 2 (NTF2) superfamily protein
MKRKFLPLCAIILSGSILFSSCIGSFALTGKVFEWNKNVGDKFVNELVFLALCIVPVYEISVGIDSIVLNSIEFWTGDNPAAAKVGETKTVKGKNGNYIVKNLENGYSITKDGQTADLIYNQEANTWSIVDNGISTELLKINNDGTANLFLANGETMNVTMDAQGVMEARQAMTNNVYFALR